MVGHSPIFGPCPRSGYARVDLCA